MSSQAERKRELEGLTLRMLTDESSWPNWPFLPMKRYPASGVGSSELGVVAAGKPIVYLTNLFSLPKGPEAWEATKNYKYENWGKMVADGWVVD